MNAALTSAPMTARRNASNKHRWLIVLILAALFCAVGSYTAAAPPPPPDVPQSTPDYLIGPGDLLQIFIWKNPDLSGEVPVRPDGRITTPLVPDVQAEGRRPTELAEALRTALAEYIQNPVVTVVVKSFAASDNVAAVRVIGSVETPKSVPYRAGLTALDALIDAGGLTDTANGNGAKLMRAEKGGYKTYPLRLKNLVRSGDAAANVKLMPGDIIQVPEKWF